MIPNVKLWRIILFTKVLLALVVVGAMQASFNLENFLHVYANWPPGGKPTFTSYFSTWDGAHYLRLSESGYKAGSESCAFYPLWPAVIHLVTAISGGWPVIASMLSANALSLVGFWLFYRLVERHYGPDISRDSLILMLAFPSAFFFSFPYSESLYLVILMAFFWGLELERAAWTAIAGFLLPLTRPVGVFVLLPLAWHFRKNFFEVIQMVLPMLRPTAATATQDLEQEITDETERGRILPRIKTPPTYGGSHRITPWFLLCCPLLGYAAYFLIMYACTGNAFAGFEAQKAYPNSPSIRNMFDISGFTNALLNIYSLDGMINGVEDRAFFFLFLWMLPVIYYLDKTWFFYALAAGLVPALTSWFMSYRRYTVMLFPVFVALAYLLSKPNSRWLFWSLVTLFGALQARSVGQFINFNWAG